MLATLVRTEAAEEFSKFLVAAAKHMQETGEPAFMPACPVDQYWHELVANPTEYQQFCGDLLGEAVSHLPTAGTGEINWSTTYEDLFGYLPEIWFQNVDGELNTADLEYYKTMGIFRASWDCNPKFLPITPPPPPSPV